MGKRAAGRERERVEGNGSKDGKGTGECGIEESSIVMMVARETRTSQDKGYVNLVQTYGRLLHTQA